ncbi:uncharacterized protein VICG_01802 [Vittaforma corneae ATCC 50505]|uniref:Methyltransferase type 11 domain-containing protein n=1 Tax=Vittaforma corneae (strain ATCC 50505) TaxID=993615 RepID=L2GJZ4_VITCO|nr:uncharacterized protein VICG_01802 [Vittaforma corneae ATCC 50505]ELA41203.1 hypothetical protein VICG_01802 [Vittaforma corneae ATCC 50505]
MPSLPEFTKPAELYYDEKESKKYHKNSRIIKVQSEMAERAIDLLEIDDKSPLILDIGCGSGLSGKVLAERNCEWIGVDISPEMLKIASSNTSSSGLICFDIGNGFPFKEESFDYAVSISTVQWLFHSFQKDHIPQKRIRSFFRSLYDTVKKRVVIQFYCSEKQVEMLKNEAIRAGFDGGLVTDGENTKNCKNFLVLNKYTAKPNTKKSNQSKSSI